jgi:lipoate-protein ligase A
VLGSTQPESDFEPDRCASAGLDLVRRRSGGGAVLVQPGAQVWADFYLPAADPLFCTDISASFIWLGELWAAAVRATTGASTTVEVASSSSDAGGWARRLCFCGITRGEVTLSGKKAVGLCQRRDRAGAWFHTMALTSLDAAATADLVAGSAQDRRDAAARLESSAVALPGDGIASALVAALLGHLGELDGGDRKP